MSDIRNIPGIPLYYSPLSSYGITPLKKDMFLEAWERGDELPNEEWDTLALVRESQFFDDKIDIEDILDDLEEGARDHGSHLCAAVHEGVQSAAYPIAAWYANRARMRDLAAFKDVDPDQSSCYDPTPECPQVPFPRNRAECLEQALFWTLNGLANDIWECETILPDLDAPDELIAKYEDLLRKASQTPPPAPRRLLACYLMRDGTSARDHAEAISLLRDVASDGDAHDKLVLAMALKECMDELPDSTPREVFRLCLEAAEAGDPSAMRELSYHYGDGFGTEKDGKLSAKWLSDGAEAGDGECRLLAGTILLDAAKTTKERREAVDWIRLAAEENDIPAAWALLADHFETGDGLYKSKKQALHCRKRAAELGWKKT